MRGSRSCWAAYGRRPRASVPNVSKLNSRRAKSWTKSISKREPRRGADIESSKGEPRGKPRGSLHRGPFAIPYRVANTTRVRRRPPRRASAHVTRVRARRASRAMSDALPVCAAERPSKSVNQSRSSEGESNSNRCMRASSLSTTSERTGSNTSLPTRLFQVAFPIASKVDCS